MTEAEFTEIYRTLARSVLSGVMRLVHNEAVAEELMQETFLQFLKAVEHKQIDSVKGLLFRISHNLAIDYLRKNSRVDNEENPESIIDSSYGESEMQYRVLRRSIIERLQKADARLLEFYVLTVDYALHIEDVARAIGVSRRSAFRLRDQLKTILAEFL
ncbi:MAG: RNA polymerase sigma factor [Spirochaetes bacterium]|nr:RNA polymerase sigma factor [Spirochaetota bacterium]